MRHYAYQDFPNILSPQIVVQLLILNVIFYFHNIFFYLSDNIHSAYTIEPNKIHEWKIRITFNQPAK